MDATVSLATPIEEHETRRLSLPVLCLLALAVGVVTGLGAVAFRALIGLVHNVLFLGRLSFSYDASLSPRPARGAPS